MFVPFARPFFACNTDPSLRPRTFRFAHKFSGDSSYVQQLSFTQSRQPVFQINGDMVLANHFPVEIELFHSMTRTYIVEPFHRQDANSRFVENVLPFGKISFLSPTLLLPSFDIRMLDIQAFHYHKTHKTTRFMSLCYVAHRL